MCEHCETKKKKKYLTEYPQLMEEFDKEANKGLDPSKLTHGSNKIVWWICPLGHKYDCKISYRTIKHYGCPYCSGHRVLEGFNDLATTHPELAKEWDNERNLVKPTEISHGSDFEAWWICSKDPEHRWKSKVSSRASVRERSCPYCSKQTSMPEYIIKYYLNKIGFNIKHCSRKFGFELDLYIPDLNIAIEYDGYYWHKDKIEKDKEKNKKCNDLGIKLYRVRENLCTLNSTSIDICYNTTNNKFDDIVKKLINYIVPNQYIDINISRDIEKIYSTKNIKKRIHDIGDVIKKTWKIIKVYDKIEKYGHELYDFQCLKCGIIKYKTYISALSPSTGTICKHHKFININGEIKTYTEWSRYFNFHDRYIGTYVKQHGLKKTVKYLTELYIEKEQNGFISNGKCHGKYIKICGIIKNYREWSEYFGKNHSFVGNIICCYGIKKAIEYLTKLYIEKEQNGFYNTKKFKCIKINNIIKTYREWSEYFERGRNFVSKNIRLYGLNETIKLLTEMYLEKQKNGFCNKKRTKYLKINNIVKTCKGWSLYFNKGSHYVSNYLKRNGLEATIEYLTELYLEKQKQESTQKDNIAA